MLRNKESLLLIWQEIWSPWGKGRNNKRSQREVIIKSGCRFGTPARPLHIPAVDIQEVGANHPFILSLLFRSLSTWELLATTPEYHLGSAWVAPTAISHPQTQENHFTCKSASYILSKVYKSDDQKYLQEAAQHCNKRAWIFLVTQNWMQIQLYNVPIESSQSCYLISQRLSLLNCRMGVSMPLSQGQYDD